MERRFGVKMTHQLSNAETFRSFGWAISGEYVGLIALFSKNSFLVGKMGVIGVNP